MLKLIRSLFVGRSTDARNRAPPRLVLATREQTRRELIAMSLRDTLKKHGIQVDCITAHTTEGAMAGRERGTHVEFLLHGWHPGLLAYLVAIQTATLARLLRLDPLSTHWVTGVSWRFEEVRLWPDLPSGKWTTAAPAQARKTVRKTSPEPLDALLQAGDAAFDRRGSRSPDFSPTIPM